MKKQIELIKETLKIQGHNYEEYIDELGQVKANERRLKGEVFNLNDHIRGVILALLSKQRPWRPIARNQDKLKRIFLDYDYNRLMKVDKDKIYDSIIEASLGNRSLRFQIDALKDNLVILKSLEKDIGSIDKFIESDDVEKIAIKISDNSSKYKIKQMGFTLAMEYLKNVGIRTVKPDTHIMRICGQDRLDLFSNSANERKVVQEFREFCDKYNYNQTYIDNLIWLFGAKEYGQICTRNPKCNICLLKKKGYCKY